LILLVSAGCSIRKVAYGWATKLVVSRFVDTFDLNANQKRDLLPRIAAIHDWHRKQELPRYVQFLDAAIGKAQDGLDQAEVEWMLAESYPLIERLSARFTPEAAAVLATLSNAQIDHAVAEFKKAEKERFEKLEQSEEDYIKFRMKTAKKNMKTWLGSYTDAQLQEYERWVRKNRPEELRRRKRYQDNRDALLAMLRTHPGTQPIAEALHNWLTRAETRATPEFQEAEKRTHAEFVNLVVTINRMMTPEQRSHFIAELKAWRTDFHELANGI
jgi:hypothetical protein